MANWLSPNPFKGNPKRLHFAGYDFVSGPEGTVVFRGRLGEPAFRIGDCVEYRDVNLWGKGTVVGADGKWIMVSWRGRGTQEDIVAKEWAPNLRICS